LSVTTLQRRYGCYVDAFSISFDNDIEVGGHTVILSHGERFCLATFGVDFVDGLRPSANGGERRREVGREGDDVNKEQRSVATDEMVGLARAKFSEKVPGTALQTC